MTMSQDDFRKARMAFVRTLQPEEINAGLFYSHKGDRVLNSALREGRLDDDPAAAKMAARLDAVIAKHPMPVDTYVARGIDGTWATKFAATINPGDVYREPGYTSTAATSPFDADVTVRIRVPAGAHAAPIPSRYPTEDEFLLPRGSSFRVVAKTKTLAGWRLDVEVISEAEAKAAAAASPAPRP